jgi:hypothetical protein
MSFKTPKKKFFQWQGDNAQELHGINVIIKHVTYEEFCNMNQCEPQAFFVFLFKYEEVQNETCLTKKILHSMYCARICTLAYN